MCTHYAPTGRLHCGVKHSAKKQCVKTLDEFNALERKNQCGNCRQKIRRNKTGVGGGFEFSVASSRGRRRTKEKTRDEFYHSHLYD